MRLVIRGSIPSTVLDHLNELRALSSDSHGAQRLAWSSTWSAARAWFERKAAAVPYPFEHHRDTAGNNWFTLRGRSQRAVLLGSHLDSVPNGGWLDGCLGVLAGLHVLTAMAEEWKGVPPVTLRLVDWADEEGARFGRSLFGSSAFAGTHTIEADRVRKDRDGVTCQQALESCGIDIERIGDASLERADAAAYLELHIEQGPVLEALQLPLGVVLGTKGVERWTVTFTGQEAHAGSTPMSVRRDALAAVAKLALALREIARRHAEAVATMGSVRTFPGIATSVVGRCETTLDLRDLDPQILAQMLLEARVASERFAVEEGCTVQWKEIWSIEPVPFHKDLIQLCEQAIGEVASAPHRLPSGPLHDAAEVARSGIPTVMMFVQSIGGLSHNAAEDTLAEHLELSLRAFERLTRKTIDWVAGSTPSS